MESLLRTDVHVVSDSVMCVEGHNAVANEAWATTISEVWNPITFQTKYDITVRPVQFHWPDIYWAHSTPDQKRDPLILMIHNAACFPRSDHVHVDA